MKGQLLGGGTAIRPLPGSPSAHPRQLPAAQGRVNPGVPPARSDGKAGKEAAPPPPQRCCRAHFCCRAWVGCSKGTRLRVLGRAKLSIQTWGFWPIPLPADRSLQHRRQCRRAELWLQHLLERRQKQLSITSPALTLPAAEGRIQHEAAASGPHDVPQDPPTPSCSDLPFPSPACKSCPCLPSPRGPAPAGCSACAVPASVRTSAAGARGRGVLERACPPGAKRAVGAGVRPLQMAGAEDPGTREPWHCHPPREGVPLPRATAGSCVSLVVGKVPSPPKTGPGTGSVPVPFSTSSPGTGRARRAPGSWIGAASSRQR